MTELINIVLVPSLCRCQRTESSLTKEGGDIPGADPAIP